MKKLIIIILVLLLIDFSIGFYLQSTGNKYATKLIGGGVLVFAFVLLPLFLYHRYRNKKIEDYTLNKEKIEKIIDNLKF